MEIKHQYLFCDEPRKYVLYVKKIYSKHFNGKQRKYNFNFLGYEIGFGTFVKKFIKEDKNFVHILHGKKDMYLDSTIIEIKYFKRKPTLNTMNALKEHINYLENDPVYIKL